MKVRIATSEKNSTNCDRIAEISKVSRLVPLPAYSDKTVSFVYLHGFWGKRTIVPYHTITYYTYYTGKSGLFEHICTVSWIPCMHTLMWVGLRLRNFQPLRTKTGWPKSYLCFFSVKFFLFVWHLQWGYRQRVKNTGRPLWKSKAELTNML